MKLSVLPDQNYYNCFHNNIYTCANYFKKELTLLFSTALNFIYHPDSKTCGESIYQYYSQPNGEMPESTNELLYKYNGVRIALQQNLTWNEFINIAEEEEEIHQRPVVLHFDTFYAPWNNLYSKQHSSEFIIIIQIGNDNITMFDPYHKKEKIALSKEQLRNSLTDKINVWKFELNESTSMLNSNVILNHIKNYYSTNNHYTVLIKKFAEKTLKTFDYETEILAFEEIEESPMIKNLKQLSYFRLVHIEFLKKIFEFIDDTNNKEKIQKAISLLNYSIQIWDKLRAVLIYKNIRKDYSSKNEWMFNKLNEIVDFESEVLSIYSQFS